MNSGNSKNKRKTVDIFCRVVDNYGDAGVCWRLARQTVFEHGFKVRLIIDQLDVLASLVPRLSEALNRGSTKRARVRRSRSSAPAFGYLVDGVRVFEWKTRKAPTPVLVGPARLLKPAHLVIAAFACDLPESYRVQMESKDSSAAERRPGKSFWMNLEYLSAEPWVETHHLLPSLKPSGLTEHFFFPGFNARTGGLLRERDLLAKRDAFLQDRDAQARLSHELGILDLFDRPRQATLLIYVFSYPNVPWQSLVNATARAIQQDLLKVERVWFLCPQSSSAPPLASPLPPGIDVKTIPRLPQERFDEILWLSDANFVRGEDSFVRAIWAGKPMIWNIYPQDEQAHRPKLESFLAMRPFEERGLSLAWNQLSDAPEAFADDFLRWLGAYDELAKQGRLFAAALAEQDDLCRQILRAGMLSP
jgi:uncharacterized repeat protein (TIGR03837 family)